MPRYINQLAKKLLKDHPGIPTLGISQEICESFCSVIRKTLIKEGTVYFEDIGKLYIKRYDGDRKRRDPQTGVLYKVAPKNVVRFEATESLEKIVNTTRKKED